MWSNLRVLGESWLEATRHPEVELLLISWQRLANRLMLDPSPQWTRSGKSIISLAIGEDNLLNKVVLIMKRLVGNNATTGVSTRGSRRIFLTHQCIPRCFSPAVWFAY
ncbi:hypothetical protein BGY98DRAFT_325897 [Russula aff. rugulosa BPL654]|nr:hypothetical protein BGY98DRAFT_325897 [Russula aff. rugulosa BPL654]